MKNLEDYANKIYKENKGKRIVNFIFEGEKFWLKQPYFGAYENFVAKFFGLEKSFEWEIEKYKILKTKPVAMTKFVMANEKFLLLGDGGASARELFERENDESKREKLIAKCARAIANMHLENSTHGHPNLDDILIQNDEVKFIDFETKNKKSYFKTLKSDDFLLFIYDLCKRNLAENFIKTAYVAYAERDGAGVIKNLPKRLTKFRIVYFLVKFKILREKSAITIAKAYKILKKIIKENS